MAIPLDPQTGPAGSPHVARGPVAYGPGGPSSLFWRQLFSLLKSGQVIPVVGQDAVIVEDERGRCTLNEYVAGRVEQLLGIPASPPDHRATLHEVACRYLETARDKRIIDVYWAVNEALDERPIVVPDALRKLARVQAFKLYVTTTFDDLLRQALDLERFGGQPRTQAYAYSPKRVQDLPEPVDKLNAPVVYHLLGRRSSVQDYVVTEEDTLEFVHSLQSENRRPDQLLDELRTRSVLLIGSGYSDWLMRFFLRITNKDRLLQARSKREIVVDGQLKDRDSLEHFVHYFSAQTEMFPGGALAFIDELVERWEEYRAAQAERGELIGAVPLPPAERPAEHPIFVSYASEDAEIAGRFVAELRRAGLPVWFDHSGEGGPGLRGGADYEAEIRARIRDASIFVPLLSRRVLTPDKRFFRIEWRTAEETEELVAPNHRFIVPVRVDDVPPNADMIPDRFKQLHWEDAPNGGDFGPVVRLLRDVYRRQVLALSATS